MDKVGFQFTCLLLGYRATLCFDAQSRNVYLWGDYELLEIENGKFSAKICSLSTEFSGWE